MINILRAVALLIGLQVVGLAAEPMRFVTLEHLEPADAVERAQDLLGPELKGVTLIAHEDHRRVYIGHVDAKAVKLLEHFFLAIDVPDRAIGMTVVGLHYMAAKDALELIQKAYGEDCGGVQAVLCERTNRLLLGGTEQNRRKVEELLLALDKKPRQIKLEAVLTRIERDKEGREVRTVLSQPTIFVQDGKEAVISTGTNPGESMELKIVASVIEEDREPKVIGKE